MRGGALCVRLGHHLHSAKLLAQSQCVMVLLCGRRDKPQDAGLQGKPELKGGLL